MHITFDYQKEQNINDIGAMGKLRTNSMTGAYQASKSNASSMEGVFFSSSNEANSVYGKKGKTMTDVMDEMGGKDASLYKNYMAVMAGTMSGEDFANLTKEGINPGKVDVKDAVTIMDHIKTVMAESGVIISGFNGATDMSIEKLTEMTGDAGYANSLKKSFEEKDLPLTEETVSDVIKQTNQATDIKNVTDDMKQYILENELPITSDTLYFASYSTTGTSKNSTGGYFMDSTNGYYGKKPDEVDLSLLSGQIEKLVEKEGLSYTDEMKANAKFLLDKGILLTLDHLNKLEQLNQLSFPLDRDQVIDSITEGIREGKSAKDASIVGEGIYAKAERLYEEVNEVSDQALSKVVLEGGTLSIKSLSASQKQIQLSEYVNATQINTQNQDEAANIEEKLSHARLVFAKVQLQMTVSANISLLKSDYAIETADLEELVDALEAEKEKQTSFGISLLNEQKEIYSQTLSKTEQIRQMPLALVGQIPKDASSITLNKVYEVGQALKSTYEKAGQSYEALMTAPRADLGDRMKDAFQNIDAILSDEGFESTEDNRRAVRILAYNQMDITQESITSIRQADDQLETVLAKMTPSATLEMIRDGVNPLEQSISDLSKYFDGKNSDFTTQTEKFSRFLYRMDKNGDISKEERESFIGIYRLIRQIEKGDKKAIGTVVANNQEMSFQNLLTAVRTNQTGHVTAEIDDQAMIPTMNLPTNSISDQIQSYYQSIASKMMDQLSNGETTLFPEALDVSFEKLADTLMEKQQEQQLQNDLLNQQITMFRDSLSEGDQAVEFLVSEKVPVTPENILAAKEHLKKKESLYQKVEKQSGESVLEKMDQVVESFSSKEEAKKAFDAFFESIRQRLEDHMMKDDATYLDVKALSLTAKQISLNFQMSNNESYELCTNIMGELTDVSVKVIHANENEPGATIQVQLSNERQLLADLKVQEDKIVGYACVNDKELEDRLKEKTSEFEENILLKTGKKADIRIIYSETITQHAGKQAQNRNEEQKEQGRQESSRQLYQTVSEFMKWLKEA